MLNELSVLKFRMVNVRLMLTFRGRCNGQNTGFGIGLLCVIIGGKLVNDFTLI